MKKLAVINVNMKRGEAASTFRVGFLPKGTKYKEVVKVFGGPRNVWPSEEQTKAQWTGEINKQTFTIYDYDSGKSAESNTDWHIGGHDESVAPLVLKYFNSKK
jgi:hypothetical protein